MSEIDEKRHPLKSLVVGTLAAVSAIYLLNPTGLSLDTAFDNIPGIGNLDEAAAVAMLLSCLSYFGLDLNKLFGGKKKSEPTEKPVKGNVVDN